MQKLPDGQITSDFPKLPFAKIIWFASGPNQFTDSPYPVPTRGAFRDRHGRGAGCGGREGVRRERQSQGEMNLVSEVLRAG
jgi:hypothetical protein